MHNTINIKYFINNHLFAYGKFIPKILNLLMLFKVLT